MSEKIVQLNEEVIKGQLKELVRGSVEETLNELLEAEAEKLTQAARYERNGQRQGYCQRRTVKNLKRRPENDPNAGNIARVIYAGTPSAGQLSAGSSAGGTGWTPAFHRSLSR